MQKRYAIAAARAKLSAIVDDVEAGSRVELTRRGKSVAVVISTREYARLQSERPDFNEAYRTFLEQFPPDEIETDEDVFKDLRDPTTGREVKL